MQCAFTERAWHAGVSLYKAEKMQMISIGIESEDTDECDFTQQQYQQLVKITQSLIALSLH